MEFSTVHEMYRNASNTRSEKPAYYTKRHGSYEKVTWREFWDNITSFSMGLMALGMEYRDPVTILSMTREEWDIADKAAMAAGGIAVGCYHSNTPAQCQHVAQHSESRFFVVENKQQWDKVAQIRKDLPLIRRYIIMDPTDVQEPDLLTFQGVLDLGRQEKNKQEKEFWRRFSQVKAEDTAIIFYTSGTTGPPKGAMLTHENVLDACRCMRELPIFMPQDYSVVWLPMPHIYGRIAVIAGVYNGTLGYYAESLDKIVENLQEIKPTIFYSVPRVFEKVHTRVMGQVAESPPAKKRVFNWALGVGLKRSRALQEKKPVPPTVALQYRLADKLVFKKIRDLFGGRARIIMSGGAPISREILEFFHAAGILPLELYGITETLLCTINTPERFRFGSVGPASPGVQARIAADGEILIKSKMVFKGYLKEEEKTREVLSADGWYATGDIGKIDPDGFVWITDRKKDLLITAGGKNVAPQNIENLMKTSPYISQFMAYGDRKPYLTALVTLDPDEIKTWAKSQGIDTSDFKALCEHPKVLALVESTIKERNKELAGYEQIKGFKIIPEEFSQESGTLTATLKVKRREVVKRYGDLLESLYTKGPVDKAAAA